MPDNLGDITNLSDINNISNDDLETLIAHEARYFEIWSNVTRRPEQVTRYGELFSDAPYKEDEREDEHSAPCIWFLDSERMPHYQSANRALHLRRNEAGRRGADFLVAEVIAHYRRRGLPTVVDVDAVAEEQGLGRELRRQGVMPVRGSTLLMRWGADTPPLLSPAQEQDETIFIQQIPNETGQGEARDWIHLAGVDEDNAEDAAFWRDVAELEARSPDCRLYLATAGVQPAGACQLFSASGWAQIDSVMTHPDFRRRGIASRLVVQAVRDSLALGNATTYLFTERGGAGEKVYRRLGFEVWGVDVLRRHILW